MKETKAVASRLVFLPWFALVVSLSCAVCLVHVQWTLHTHRVQIDDLMKQNKEFRDSRAEHLLKREDQTKGKTNIGNEMKYKL
jgi:hypothetical protein